MKKNMARLIVATLLIMVCLPPVYATNARVEAMGGYGGYFDNITNIFSYPTQIADYPNYMLIELGTLGKTDTGGEEGSSSPADPSMGGIVALSDALSLGIYFNRYHIITGIVNENEKNLMSPLKGGMAKIENRLDLLGSLDLGNASVGVGVYVGSGVDNDGTNDKESSILAFNFGGSLDLQSIEIDGSFSIDTFSITNKTASGDEEWESDGFYRWSIRAAVPLSENIEIVPEFRYQNGSTKYRPANGGTQTQDYNNLDLGAGINYRNGESFVTAGLTYYRYRYENKSVDKSLKTTGFPLLFNIGYETKMLTDWLVGRVGVQKRVFGTYKSSSKNTTIEKSLLTSDDNFLSLGLGIEIDSFRVDAVIFENNLYSFTGLFSGLESNIVSRVSILYQF